MKIDERIEKYFGVDHLLEEDTKFIKQLISEVVEEVIGEDEEEIITDINSPRFGEKCISSIVDRDNQRQKLKEILK